MLLPRHGHMMIDIKLILSVNVFKIPPLGVSGPKNKIFCKPEVNHKKSENLGFLFGYSFQTRLKGTNGISDRFCTQNDYKPNRKCTRKH